MKLEKAITSLRLVTILVIVFIISYAFKIGFLLYETLEVRIPNRNPRLITSALTSIIFSVGLFVGSVHMKSKLISFILFVFDIVMMSFILPVYTSKGIELFKSCFLSLLFAATGFLIISVFVTKYYEAHVQLERIRAKKEQTRARAEQMVAFKCVCEKGFPSKQALSGHQRSCEKHNQNKNKL
jgi:hypothetical protein